MNNSIVDTSLSVGRNHDSAVPAGFQQTEVGVVPKHWTVETCDALCLKIQDGTHFSPKLGGGDYLYVTSRNIGFGVLDVSDAETVSETEHRKIYSRCDVRKGDLLLTKDGANTGNAAISNIDEEISLLSSIAFLRFRPENDARFYLQYILSHIGQERIKQLMSGNAITRLTLTKIRQFKMPRPPEKEQQMIADVLSDVDSEIVALDCRREKTKQLKQGMMQELLSGRTKL